MSYQYFTQRPVLGPHSRSPFNPLVSATEGLANRYRSMADDGSQQTKIREAANSYFLAEGHLLEAQPDECLLVAAKALQLFREIGDQVGAADILTIIINAHMLNAFVAMEKPDEALRVATSEKAEFARAGDKRGEACMKLALANIMARTSKGGTDLVKSLALAQDAHRVFQDGDDKKMEASAQLILLNIHYLRNQAEEAHQAADVAETIFTNLGDKIGQAKARHGRGIAYLIPEDFANAVKSAQSSLALYQELGDKRGEAFQLSMIAQWQLLNGKPHNSYKTAKEAYEIALDLRGTKYSAAFALSLICDSLIERDKAKEAITMAQAGMEQLEKSGHAFEVVAGLEIKLQSQLSGESPADALDTSREAIRRAQDFGDRRLEINLLYTVCQARMKNGKDDEAVNAMRDVQSLARELGDQDEEADALRMESYIWSTTKELGNQPDVIRQAIQAAESARDLYKRVGRPGGEASSLLLVCFFKSHDRETQEDELLGYAKDARALFHEAEDISGEHSALNMIVDLRMGAEQHEKALEDALSSVDMFKSLGKKRAQAEAMYRVADIYTKLQERDHAMHEIVEAQQLCRDVGAQSLEAKLLLLLTQNYVAKMAELQPEQGGHESDIALPDAVLSIRAKANTAVKDALLLAGKSGDRSLRAAALFWKSEVLVWGRQAGEALRSAQEAERLFGQIKDFRGQAHATVLCADLHYVLGQKKEALGRASKALQIARNRPECAEAEAGAQSLLGRLDENHAAAAAQTATAPASPSQQAPAIAAETKPKMDASAVIPKVLELAKNALQDDSIDFEEDSEFFDSGIDSLSSVQLTADISRHFQIQLSASAMFDFPTPKALVNHIIEESMG